MRRPSTSPRTIFALAALLAGGCSGRIAGNTGPDDRPDDGPDQTPSRPDGTRPPGTTTPVPPGTVPPTGTAPPTGAPPTGTAAVAPLVRLTPVQLDNVAQDLFGVAGAPAADFPAIAINDASVDLHPLVKAQLTAAETVATRAFGGRFAMTCATAIDRACADGFVTGQGRLLFRRAVSADEKSALLKVYDDSAGLGPREALRQTLVAMLVSVPFLYRIELPRAGASVSPDELATRMSFLAWNSGPTAELLDLAARGGLATGAARGAQLETMLKSEKGARMSRDLVAGWLGTRKVTEIRKEGTSAFTPAIAAAMAQETERFAAETFAAPASSFAELFTAGHSYLNDALKPIYGVGGTKGAELERVALPAGQRSGVLTHGALLAVHTNPIEASPVERGVFIQESLLCQSRPPVPQDVPALPPAVTNGKRLTQRQRLEQHRASPACSACHAVFDGYGLALEKYDLVGRYIEKEGDTPLTGEATVAGLDGKTQRFAGALELGKILAESPTARACFVEKVFALTQGMTAEQVDPAALARVTAAFRTAGDMRKALIDIAADNAFATRRF